MPNKRTKVLYIVGSIVFCLFAYTQISRWRMRSHDVAAPQVAVDKSVRLVDKAKLAPLSPGAPQLQPSPSPAAVAQAPVHKVKKPLPKPTPIPPKETCYFQISDSKIFAYLIKGDEQIKVDLLYDLAPETLKTFVRGILNCCDKSGPKSCKRKIVLDTIPLHILNRSPSAVLDLGPNKYRGFVYLSKGKQEEDSLDLTYAMGAAANVPMDMDLLGGVVSVTQLSKGSKNTDVGIEEGTTIIYSSSDVKITYRLGEDEGTHEDFQNALQILRNGCGAL